MSERQIISSTSTIIDEQQIELENRTHQVTAQMLLRKQRPKRANFNHNNHQMTAAVHMLSAASLSLLMLLLTTTSVSSLQAVSDASASNHTCNYPGSPAHASVTFNTSQIVAGTAASYTCDNGYELLGPPRRFCQANGTWAPVGIPFCGKFFAPILSVSSSSSISFSRFSFSRP